MNIEAIIDESNRVWLIDVGPRSGGNMIPDLLGYIYNIDIAEISIKAALGEEIDILPQKSQYCYATYNIHSELDGQYKGVIVSEDIKKYVVRKCLYKRDGDKVERFDNASKCLGIIFMRFESEEIMNNVLKSINEKIQVQLK